ncbi:MAG: SCO family protein [Proteobacteria bacterium]|nr:SCO family protein [Pseudomonadota bacterium]
MHQQELTNIEAIFDGTPEISFELYTRDNQPVTPETFAGKYLLVAIGFTRCEHICPVIAANMAAVLRDTRIPTSGIFISIDNERDTPDDADRYAKSFHPDLVGASGSYEALVKTAENLKATFVVTKSPKSYTVQHTPDIYLADTEGNFIEAFAFVDGARKIIATIETHHAQ